MSLLPFVSLSDYSKYQPCGNQNVFISSIQINIIKSDNKKSKRYERAIQRDVNKHKTRKF